MAPRRGLRPPKSVNNISYSNISLSDVLCPICRCILIQPVTLPCNHDFCLSCFEGTLANANLTCPLCRVRFGSWHRIAKKDNKVINEKLWDILQHKFAGHVKNRLQGIEENLEEDIPIIKLTIPGEIRKEYEAQKRVQDLEIQKQKELEEKASDELIRKLQEQEDYEQILREEKLKLDEKVARQLAKEMGIEPKPSVSKIECSKKKNSIEKYINNMKSKGVKQAEKVPQYLNNIINKEKNNKQKNLMNFSIEITDSNDSIENECRFFKPIDHRNIPPSKCGTILRVPAIVKKTSASAVGAPNGKINFSPNYTLSAFARFEMISSPILGLTVSSPPKNTQSRKRKLTDPDLNKSNHIKKKLNLIDAGKVYNGAKLTKHSTITESPPKKRPSIRKSTDRNETEHKMTLRGRKISGSPFHGFTSEEISPLIKFNGKKEETNNTLELQEKADLEFAKKLQEEFNKERYSTRSSISCRNNIRKSRQATITEIMSTSKCK